MSVVVHKRTTLSESKDGLEFVLSSERVPDRYGDYVRVAGIGYKNYLKNPVVLWNHQSDAPIGTMRNLRVEGQLLRGDLHLAPRTTSPRLAEIHALVECGVLRAVSIGFLPIESSQLSSGGRDYKKTELVEVSLVAVPANAEALMQAKALGVSTKTISEIFRQQTKATTLAERIAASKLAVKKYSKAEKAEVLRRARATLSKSKSRSQPKLLPVSPEARLKAERQQYNKAVLERAKAMVAEHRAEKAERKRYDLLAIQDDPPQNPSPTYVTWKGVKIPVNPRWRGKYV
jgi:HK97 family phage prohead protease